MTFNPSKLDDRIKDWRWRCNNLYKIIDKQGNLITFREKWIHKQINDCKKKRKLILKYRQGGVTTGEVIKQLDYCAFNKNKTACIMADEQGNMERIFSKVRLAHKYMPKQFQPVLAKGGGSKYEMKFEDLNSRIYCDLEGRGDTIHWLHISEAAFAHPKRIRSTLEAVPVNGIITFESTANGMGNDFYRRWIQPDHRTADLFFPWFLEDGYEMNADHVTTLTKEERGLIAEVKKKYGVNLTKEQIAFRRAKILDQQELYLQEYPEDDMTCFLSSGSAPFNLSTIKDMMDDSREPIEDLGIIKIFKEHDRHKHYVVGVDTAEGGGGDYSVATVMEIESMEEVAQLRSNKLKPRTFAHKVSELCHMFSSGGKEVPLLGVERNNHGHSVLLELEEHIDYDNLYYFKEGKVGWNTDSISRPIMINTFVDGVENGSATLNSRDTIGECLTLVNNSGKIEAEEGEHDDCIVSVAIAIQMCIKSLSDIDLYNDLSNKILL